MSWEAVRWAWDIMDVSPLAKLLAIWIADSYPLRGEYRCKIESLERFTSSPRFDLMVALDELEGECGGFRFWVEGAHVRVSIPLPKPEKLEEPLARATRKKPHWVYVIRADDLTKIGIARNVKERFDSLQAWAPQKLTVVWAGKGPVAVIRKIERAAHADLAAYRAFGEWFRVSSDVALAAVQRQMLAHGLSLSESQ